MSNKITVLFLFFASIIYLAPLTSPSLIMSKSFNSYKSLAKNWISTHLATTNREERVLIANLFYWSYQRSFITLKTQKSATKALDTVWFDWNTLTRTRRNPALALQSSLTNNSTLIAVKKFEKLKKEYHETGAIYVLCTDALIKENYLNESLTQALKDLRNNARKAIFTQMITLPMKRSWITDNHKDTSTSLFILLKNFWQSLPGMSITSFVEFDKKYIEVSSQCWENFMTAHEQANNIWVTIENARIAFYAAHYNALMKYSVKNYPNDEVFYKCFDIGGFIPREKQTLKLPEKII